MAEPNRTRSEERLEEEIDEENENNLDEEGEDPNPENAETCPKNCKGRDKSEQKGEEDRPDQRFCRCKHTVGSLTRFSVRVMEAMRSLGHNEEAIGTSTIEDIVNYIETNRDYDGDLYAQVRTVMKQICSQGFATEIWKDEYHLIGPCARTMNDSSKDMRGCICAKEDLRDLEKSAVENAVRSPEAKRQRSPNRGTSSCVCPESNRDRSRSGIDRREKVDVERRRRRDSLARRKERSDLRHDQTTNNNSGKRFKAVHRRESNARAGNTRSIVDDRCVCDEDDNDRTRRTETEPENEEETEERVARARREKKRIHDGELKRWIQKCRRECVRRARAERRLK